MQEMVAIPLNHAASYQVKIIAYLKAYSQGKSKKGVCKVFVQGVGGRRKRNMLPETQIEQGRAL